MVFIITVIEKQHALFNGRRVTPYGRHDQEYDEKSDPDEHSYRRARP